MADNLGLGVSRVLVPDDKSWEMVVWRANKSPLDSELILNQQISSQKIQKALQTVPSGYLEALKVTIETADLAPGTLSLNTVYGANEFLMTPHQALISGTMIDVVGGSVNGAGASPDGLSSLIKLDPPPATGSREDLVFLEVWQQLVVASPSTVGKPSPGELYPFGNTQWSSGFIAEDLRDPAIVGPTTNRIQWQYRIRVESDLAFTGFPNGVDDTTVFPNGATTGDVVAFNFQLLSDNGVYVAGDGDSASQASLGTVDGFVYALPIARIHRRNSQPFEPTNVNGTPNVIADGVSDRPDGLFRDEINIWDVEDLRHGTSISGRSVEELMTAAKNGLFVTGLQILEPTEMSITSQGTRVLQIDGVSITDQLGVRDIAAPNLQRRLFSDAARAQFTAQDFTTSDKSVGTGGGNWVNTDEFEVLIAAFSPIGTAFSSNTPTVRAIISGVVTTIAGSWAGLGTTGPATYTLGINGGLTQEDLIVNFEIDYPSGDGLSFKAQEYLQVRDPVGAEDLSFAQEGEDFREVVGLVVRTVNTFEDVVFDKNIIDATIDQIGGVRLAHFHVDGGGTNAYTIPPTIGGKTVINVVEVVELTSDTSLSYTETQALDDSIDITLGVVTPPGETLLVKVALVGTAVSLESPIRSITEIGETVQLTTTLAGETAVSFNLSEMVLSTQGRDIGSGFEGRVYVNNIGSTVTWTFDPESSIATVDFGAPTAGQFKATLVVSKTLSTSDKLQLFYIRKPYFGNFLADNQAVGGFKSAISSDPLDGGLELLVLKDDIITYHTTAGSGGFNPAADGSATFLSTFLENIPFRHTSGTTIDELDATEFGPIGMSRDSALLSQPRRNSDDPALLGTESAFAPLERKLRFLDFGDLESANHMSGLLTLNASVNHVNFSMALCLVLTAATDFKVIAGEVVLLVVSETALANDTTEVSWKENPDNVLWEVYTLPGRPLLPIV